MVTWADDDNADDHEQVSLEASWDGAAINQGREQVWNSVTYVICIYVSIA